MMTKKKILVIAFLAGALWSPGSGEESLFKPEILERPLVRKLFSYIETHKDQIIEEWIFLTEIPAPSGQEAARAAYIKAQFEAAGLDRALIDRAGNAVGVWTGSAEGKRIVIPAHMDTVFQGIQEIKVVRDGNVLKAPGIGDDTASLIHLLWSIRALKEAAFLPENTYYFVGTVGEETGFVGMRSFLDRMEERVEFVISLDWVLGGVN